MPRMSESANESQARAAEFALRQVAARKGDLLQAALVEHGTPHDSLPVRHETQAPQCEIGEFRLAALEGHMLHRRFGEVRPHELAIQELHPLETAPRQVGVRQVAVLEGHIREMRSAQRARREKAAREKARLHPDMFPVKVRENNAAENASGNLFAFGQRPAIGMFHGIGGRDWSGYLHL